MTSLQGAPPCPTPTPLHPHPSDTTVCGNEAENRGWGALSHKPWPLTFAVSPPAAPLAGPGAPPSPQRHNRARGGLAAASWPGRAVARSNSCHCGRASPGNFVGRAMPRQKWGFTRCWFNSCRCPAINCTDTGGARAGVALNRDTSGWRRPCTEGGGVQGQASRMHPGRDLCK